MLARAGGAPVGLPHCVAGEYYVGTDAILVAVHSLVVARVHRRRLGGGRVALGLLSGARTWALARGAAELSVHVTSGVEVARTDRLLRRLGFEATGGSYAVGLGGKI